MPISEHKGNIILMIIKLVKRLESKIEINLNVL